MTAEHTLALSGELGIVDAAALRLQWLTALAEHPGDLTLDLSAVEACDSAGVQLLLALRRSLLSQGRSLRVGAAAPAVRQALATYGLDSLLAAPQGETA
jgi:anti-sigma B factor antagonist